MSTPRYRRQIISDGPNSNGLIFDTSKPSSSSSIALIFDTVRPMSNSATLTLTPSRSSSTPSSTGAPLVFASATPVVGTSIHSISLILDTGTPDASNAVPFPSDSASASGASSADWRLGLGVGLGLGIPLLLVTITLIIFCTCFWNNQAKQERRRKSHNAAKTLLKGKAADIEANEGKQVFAPSEHDKIKVSRTTTIAEQPPPEPGGDDRVCQVEGVRDVEIAESQEAQEPAGPLEAHEIYELPTRNSNGRMDPNSQGDSHSQREVSISSSLYRWL